MSSLGEQPTLHWAPTCSRDPIISFERAAAAAQPSERCSSSGSMGSAPELSRAVSTVASASRVPLTASSARLAATGDARQAVLTASSSAVVGTRASVAQGPSDGQCDFHWIEDDFLRFAGYARERAMQRQG